MPWRRRPSAVFYPARVAASHQLLFPACHFGAQSNGFCPLQFRYQRDDGCIVYLNGNPIITNNMPAGPVTLSNLREHYNYPGLGKRKSFGRISGPRPHCSRANNVIAAELHQSTATSSDIAWEVEVQGLPASASCPDRNRAPRRGRGGFLERLKLLPRPRRQTSWAPGPGLQNATSPWKVNAQSGPAFFRLHKP